jgi:hypothetical protein
MSNRGPHLAGQIISGLSFRRLADLLRAGDLSAEVRDSSHYEGGRYIRVTDDGDFTLEKIEADEYLARAEMDTAEQLLKTASRTSDVLTSQRIKHRFELYDEKATLVCYRHYQWPQDTVP